MPAPGGCADPLNWTGCFTGGVAKGVANSIFDQLAQWWADAFKTMMDSFSKGFLKAGDISLGQFQRSGLWKLEVTVGATIAAGSMIWAGARSAWTRRGEAIAVALAGLVKAVLGTAMVFTVVTVLMGVADGLTQAVMQASAGTTDGFAAKLGGLANLAGLGGSTALVFFFGLMGVLITALLWVEMLVRAAGIVIVTVSTPIGAGGLVNEHTAGWWRKLVSAELALIFVKPVIALVLAVGFTVASNGTGIQGVIVGFMILAAAALAWPVIIRLFSFFEVELSAGSVGAVLGFAGGLAAQAWGSRSTGAQPMWQSMEQASDRGGGGPSALGTPGGPSGVGGGGGGGGSLPGGGLLRAAADVRTSAAVVGRGGAGAAGAGAGGAGAAGALPMALALAAGVELTTKAIKAPGHMIGRAAQMSGAEGEGAIIPHPQPEGPWSPFNQWSDQAQLPAEAGPDATKNQEKD
jgi:hypothetical protein